MTASDAKRQDTPRWRRLLVGRHPRRTLARAVLLGLLAYGLFGFVWRPVLLRGVSMEPTYRNRALHLVWLRAYAQEDPCRFDVVAIRTAGARAFYLKRILGLPGERVELTDGTLRIDGEVVPEPYLVETGNWTQPEMVLGPGEYYVAGDNRSMPREQHTHGVVQRADVAGKLVW